jgi:hypothetical protein
MWQKLKLLWASLPHQIQAALIAGGAASGESIAHMIEEGQIPHDWPGVKHVLSSALVTGVAAAYAFYRLPSGAAQLVAQAKAANAAAEQNPPQK